MELYGKMSLTNYITQSIIRAVIYFPFGLYLTPYCGYTVSLLIGLFTFFLQVLFYKWKLDKHNILSLWILIFIKEGSQFFLHFFNAWQS